MTTKDRTGTVLIVDDDAWVLNPTTALLKSAGFTPIPCANARDAMQSLQQNTVDAVLTDIRMPDVSGIELLEQIHGYDPEIPVIMLTGHADAENAIAAIKRGAFDFLQKPYQFEQLIAAVGKAVEHRRLLRREAHYQKVLEELNLQVETLISERSMNLMALTVADRVRNPATVIGLASRRALDSGQLSGPVQELVQMIVGQAAKLEAIVADFHRMLKERKSLFVYKDLNDVVRDVVSIVEKEAAARDIAFVAALADGPLLMNMEITLMRLAILHVVRNANEATGAGGQVRLQTSCSGEQVVIEVTDTGKGIPPEELARVFDPFFTTKDHRFGMGLPLVKQIVSEHLGEIVLTSEPGKGTTVRMTFPVRWKEAPEWRTAP